MVEERKRILKLVEDGKISAEEALVLLESLDDAKKQQTQHSDNAKEIVTELSTDVKFQEKKKDSYQQSYQQSSVKTKFIDFVDTALKKIKDLDLDFNFGNAIEISHIFQHSDVYLKDIQLDVSNGSIKLIPWDENDVRIECSAKVYNVENTESARQAFLKDVLFSIETGKLSFSIQKKQMKVNAIVYVPKAAYETVAIRMFNGPITGEKIEAKTIKAKTANGEVAFTNTNATAIELETANGHIKLIDSVCKDLEAETINGTISAFGEFEKVDLQSFNGNVICTLKDESCHTAHIKTTTGNVDVFVPTKITIDGELKSNLGSFKCEIPNMEVVEEKSEVVQKSMRFKANRDQTKPLTIFAETKAGSIVIKPVRGDKE